MSKAALCATSTVSLQNSWKAGSTSSMFGLPRSMSARDAVDLRRLGRQIALRIDQLLEALLLSSLPLTMRAAPIWMISSPPDGSRPVVSVSNTVKVSSLSSRSSSSWLESFQRNRSKS